MTAGIRTLTINGEPRATEAVTISDFLASISLPSQMVVVEHNGEIVPRERYGEQPLHDGDTLEVVQMMAGG
jgi:thiamine biosynthesis protein ThiS